MDSTQLSRLIKQEGDGRIRVNIARKIEMEKRYHVLNAEKVADPAKFKKDKKKSAELFDIYQELLSLDAWAKRKQKAKDTAKKTGRTNFTPPKKRKRKK